MPRFFAANNCLGSDAELHQRETGEIEAIAISSCERHCPVAIAVALVNFQSLLGQRKSCVDMRAVPVTDPEFSHFHGTRRA